MRTIQIRESPHTQIIALDDPGEGGASHVYSVQRINSITTEELDKNPDTQLEYALIRFQNGPIKVNGVNGCQQEDLLAIVIDRLHSFQEGSFPCVENARALSSCYEALGWLESRTRDRICRNVEG